MNNRINLKQTLRFAEKLAQKVGKFIHKRQNSVQVKTYKDRGDFVTNIDLEAEELIIDAIEKAYPSHHIFSEEAGEVGEKGQEGEYRWIIDPIDGTKEFFRGIPQWNTCFALEHLGNPVLSVIYRPTSQELLSAAQGVGVFTNQKTAQPSSQSQIDQSYVFSYLPTYKTPEKHSKTVYQHLSQLSQNFYRLRGVAEESTAIAWVGTGKIEAAVNLCRFPQWYDFVPGLVIAQQAGCMITDLEGTSIYQKGNYQGYVVAASKVIHRQILKVINS